MAYSIQRAVSDGTLSRILISLKYFDKIDLKVYVDNKVLPQDGTVGNGYKYIWDGETIVITPVVPMGLEVTVRRTTKFDEPYHLFDKGAVFKDSTVDENFRQALYIAQEATEGATQTDFYQDLNFHGYRLTKVGNAIADDDAVPFAQYRADAAGAYQNRVVAESARVAALASQNASGSSAAAASTSATNAASSEANSLTYKNQTSTLATSASASQAAAAASASTAQDWAVKLGGTVNGVDYSAKYWAQAAASAALPDASITTAKLADGAVSRVKLATAVQTELNNLRTDVDTNTGKVNTLVASSGKLLGSSSAVTSIDIAIPAGMDEFNLTIYNTAWSTASNPAILLNAEVGSYVGTVNALGTTYTDYGHLHTASYIPLFHTNAVVSQFNMNIKGVRQGNGWVITGTGTYGGTTQLQVVGSKLLSAELSSVRVYGATFSSISWAMYWRKY